jgi:hypothetical protein
MFKVAVLTGRRKPEKLKPVFCITAKGENEVVRPHTIFVDVLRTVVMFLPDASLEVPQADGAFVRELPLGPPEAERDFAAEDCRRRDVELQGRVAELITARRGRGRAAGTVTVVVPRFR